MAAFIKQRQHHHNSSGQGGNQPPGNTQINLSQIQQGANQMMSSMTGGGQVQNQPMGMNQGLGMNQTQPGMGPQPMGMQQGMMQHQNQRFRPIHLQQQGGQFGGGAQFQQPAPPYQGNMVARGMTPGFQNNVNMGMRQPVAGGMMPGNMMNQQMLSQVRSPSPGMPVRSPNPAASPRPGPGMVQSPHHHMGQVGEDVNGTSGVMMLGQPTSMASNMNIQTSMMESSGGQVPQEPSSMTPQDQLSKFVETL